MSEERVVTLSEIRNLIKEEKLKPGDLFDEDAIKQIQAEGESKGYAEALSIMRAEKEKNPDPPKDESERYTDPKHNPLIKTGDE